MPTTTTEIRKDHKKWKCNHNVGGKPCGKINRMGIVYCDCGSRRKCDDEALAQDDAVIGKMYKLDSDMTENWEYTSPEPL
ncbi:hypothetical protein F66182_1093 [Fusarium sp. NRRL 66182]|nr:hypothetical protein F66182_1093 [Fusarium sp. NRRL 66182]